MKIKLKTSIDHAKLQLKDHGEKRLQYRDFCLCR